MRLFPLAAAIAAVLACALPATAFAQAQPEPEQAQPVAPATATATQDAPQPEAAQPDAPAEDAPSDAAQENDEPVADEPVDEPVSDEPASDAPAPEEPVSDEPVSDEPVSNESASEEPAPEEPVSEEPASEEPASEQPVLQDPSADPATDPTSPDAPDDPQAAVNDAPSDATSVPLDEIRRYVSVYNAIRQAYVEPVQDKALMQSAIRGLLLDLDPHSAYLERSDAEEFDERARGAYDGIGVELLRQPDDTLLVIAPIDDTPAARAGIKSGDVIVAVDGQPIGPADEASEPLRGAPGTPVVLTIQREGREEPFDVTVVRETIRIASVRGRMLEPGYGYVRVSVFQADTGADFARTLDRLAAQAGGKLRGLVLDVRSNPGGLLTTAVQIADELIERGTIVSTRGRIAVSDTRFTATPGDRLHGAPLVVLVDAGSASAAEVLAGALGDNGRARIVGSRTFGKGSVQTVLPLDNGDSVKLTTARYYTPSGKSIQALGIVPDVVLHAAEADAEDAEHVRGSLVTEATLPGHLRGDGEDEAGVNAGEVQAGEVLSGEAPITAALAELKRNRTTGAAARSAPIRN